MLKKTSKLAVASLVVFIVSIVGIVTALLIYRCGGEGALWCRGSIEVFGYLSPIIFFPALFVSIGLAIISLFLILIKRHKLKGLVYPSIVLILLILVWVYPPLNPLIFFNRCPSLEKEIFFGFPHYQNKFLNPYDRGPECAVNFHSPDFSDQIVGYYREQLQRHGWNITEDKSNYVVAEREGFSYSISANRAVASKITEVRIWIQKMK